MITFAGKQKNRMSENELWSDEDECLLSEHAEKYDAVSRTCEEIASFAASERVCRPKDVGGTPVDQSGAASSRGCTSSDYQNNNKRTYSITDTISLETVKDTPHEAVVTIYGDCRADEIGAVVECESRPKRIKKADIVEKTPEERSHKTSNNGSTDIPEQYVTNSNSDLQTKISVEPAEASASGDKSSDDSFRKTRSPLQRFRPGYLWVSDLTRQSWCEQQLYYSFTVPTLVEENPVITEGTNLHLERELAVHDVVNVKVTSSEDIWAIKVLNMINAIQVFLNGGKVAREVPIFGAPFDEDVFIVGLIDELRFDPDFFSIELWELKTRQKKSMPSKAQKAQHRLQVFMYQKLFDDLVKGLVRKETVVKHLRLSLTEEFGDDVKGQIEYYGFSCKTLDALMTELFTRMQSVTCIQGLGIEYVHQDSKETIGIEMENYNEEELCLVYKNYLKFWRGERKCEGVDIEEAWKCQYCDFADICDWRKQKAEEYSKKSLFQ